MDRSFGDVIYRNSLQDMGFVGEIRFSLKEGDFSVIRNPLRDLLKKLFSDDATKGEQLLSVFDNLALVSPDERVDLLVIVMKEIISKTYMGESAFFECAEFPWIESIERSYLKAYKEIEPALGNIDVIPAFQEISEHQRNLTNDDRWKVITFQSYGEVHKENLDLFPATAELLDEIPDWTTGMYSILMPGKRIPRHTGPYKGVLRYHLGIRVPDDCAIEVNGEERCWQEGRSLVFDDSFEHSAWNNSSSVRVVLFVDFLRPLPFPLNELNRWVVLSAINGTAFIQDVLKNKAKYHSMQEVLSGAKL